MVEETTGLKTGASARRTLLPALLLLLAAAAFGRVVANDFITFDDLAFIHENPPVRDGLSPGGVRWAFVESWGFQGNAIPLTWLSHMLDAQLFGLRPGGHHLTSLLLHLANVALFAWVALRMTGRLLPALMAAALWGLHPLRVESVAWVAERKDVLSACFFLLVLLAWRRYLDAPSKGRYVGTAALFLAGLLAKPMLVTLPFLLFLLDWWPLGRWSGKPPRHFLPLLLEKLPLVVISGLFSLTAYLAQSRGGAIVGTEKIPLVSRVANALVAPLGYLRRAIWPLDLAVFYPHPGSSVGMRAVVFGACVLALVTVGLALLRRHPALLAGWLWFLGLLLPVSGIVQIGHQALADRYTYLPMMGLCLGLAWEGRPLAGRARSGLPLLLCALLVLPALGVLTFRQAGWWRDSRTLFSRAIEVTGDNWVAEYHLGGALARLGRTEESRRHYDRSLTLRGLTAMGPGAAGNPSGAADGGVLALPPGHGGTAGLIQLGELHAARGNLEEAIGCFQRAAEADPGSFDVRAHLGVALATAGRTVEALEELTTAANLNPSSADTQVNRAVVLERLGRSAEAVEGYRRALALRPGDPLISRRLDVISRRSAR